MGSVTLTPSVPVCRSGEVGSALPRQIGLCDFINLDGFAVIVYDIYDPHHLVFRRGEEKIDPIASDAYRADRAGNGIFTDLTVPSVLVSGPYVLLPISRDDRRCNFDARNALDLELLAELGVARVLLRRVGRR